jgi:hypothetical protein
MKELPIADQVFISKLNVIVLVNLENENFGVGNLAQQGKGWCLLWRYRYSEWNGGMVTPARISLGPPTVKQEGTVRICSTSLPVQSKR